MKTTFITRSDTDVGAGEYDSVQWVLDTHAKLVGDMVLDTSIYESAILYGDEDSPRMIEFYLDANPGQMDKPLRFEPTGWMLLECHMMGGSRLGELTILHTALTTHSRIFRLLRYLRVVWHQI